MRILAVLKKKVLLGSRTLNREPESVRCELFQKDFFDPHDRAQVKYEMLRSHSVDKRTVAEVCREFGFSRESFYRIKEAFKQMGFGSLLPAKTGRKGPTKLKGEVLKFALEKKKEQPDIDPGQLADLIAKRYGVHVHRTTVMRAMKKKPHPPTKRPARRFRRKRRPGAGDL
jgi:transposase